jgi:flagellar hook-length control protein FliK
MIRRLHEIEPPKLALPSEKSNKSEDPTAKESLASEFKKLLERARSGVSGARDEVTALGFALSQAVSTVQQQQAQVQGPSHAEGAQTQEGQGDSTDDESVDCAVQHDVVVLKDSAPRKETGAVDQGAVGDDDKGDADVENLGDGAIDLDQGGDEISLEDEIVYADLDELDIDAEILSQSQGLGVQVLSQHLMVGQNQTEAAENSEADLNLDSESGLQRVALSDEAEVEEDTWSDDFVSDDLMAQAGTSELARPQLSSKRATSKGDEQHSTGNQEIDRLLTQFQAEESHGSAGMEGEFSTRMLGGENRLNGDVEKSFVGTRREASAWADTGLMNGLSPSREKNGELSMQLSLLRQAYESLKAQTAGSVDSKSKSASAGVSGVGATAEPRAAQNDAAPRVAKYLNRATSQKMMERIETALKEAARSRDGKTITLRLDPMQLGQVKCDVSLRDGLLHARITPHNPDVVNAVREHAHELQTALRRLGLNVDRVSVQVLSDKDSGVFAQNQGFLDGKSFQQDGNNMPGKERQTPENTFGNEFADVPRSGTPDAGITPVDHLIA